jgi:hypothetical protein
MSAFPRLVTLRISGALRSKARAVIFREGDTIEPDCLPERIRKRQGGVAGLKIARSGENMSEMKDQKAAMLRGLGVVTAAKTV